MTSLVDGRIAAMETLGRAMFGRANSEDREGRGFLTRTESRRAEGDREFEHMLAEAIDDRRRCLKTAEHKTKYSLETKKSAEYNN